MSKIVQILIVAAILISLLGFSICFTSVTDWFSKPKTIPNFQSNFHMESHRLKPFPVNTIAGPLQVYHQQWLNRSTASFVPEVEDYRIIFRLRLHDFLNMNLTRRYHFQNLFFNCYSESNHSSILVLTLKISVSLYPNIGIFTEVVSSSSASSAVRRIKNASIQQLLVPLPILLSENTSYKFSYRTDAKPESSLQWPTWPPSVKCVDICKANQYYSNRCLECSLTDRLKVVAPHKLLSVEKRAISSWLNFQYQVSNYSRISNHRRINPFERAEKKSVCPSQFHAWTSKYQIWHSDVARQISRSDLTFAEQRELILRLDIRFIVVKTFGSGLADRITHLIASYLIAMLTQRFLVLDDSWSEFHEVTRSSLAYRSETITPWLSKLDELNSYFGLDFQRFFISKFETAGLSRLYRDFDYDKEYPERILLIKSHVGNVIHTLTSPSSIYAPFLDKELHMEADNLFGCLYHSLIIPRLSTLVEICSMEDDHTQYLLQTLMFPQHRTIGIQIRVGDSFMDDKKPYLANSIGLLANFSGYFDCAQNLTSRQSASLVYLISDSVDLRLAALAQWPYHGTDSKQIQVIASSKPVRHVTYTSNPLSAYRTAVFETFLFSLCDTHIITTNSGFGRFAAFASLYRRPFYSFNQWEHPYCVMGEGQVTFMHAGHQWSGV